MLFLTVVFFNKWYLSQIFYLKFFRFSKFFSRFFFTFLNFLKKFSWDQTNSKFVLGKKNVLFRMVVLSITGDASQIFYLKFFRFSKIFFGFFFTFLNFLKKFSWDQTNLKLVLGKKNVLFRMVVLSITGDVSLKKIIFLLLSGKSTFFNFLTQKNCINIFFYFLSQTYLKTNSIRWDRKTSYFCTAILCMAALQKYNHQAWRSKN